MGRGDGPPLLSSVRAYVGLGANLGDREATLRAGLALLAADPDVEVVAVSAFRETNPVGLEDQPLFLNAAAAVDTTLAAKDLLALMLTVERRLGRERAEATRWGPRTIDLDLLLYDDARIDEPGLQVPHPRLHERAFALEPLSELDPGLVVPGRGEVEALLARLQ
ncbi:MAG: 2-amino-4-hydroxy-6-hydroxymethyldihydropteridine diphosphokinase [Actinomycetota bacterium]|nr:2-amino-4-hydroxy-6-hydroxymethyldihydropteridine diphosphokinase [Actinomycetota bacterium]